MIRASFWLPALLLALTSTASAQEMGQGQAHITARSNVRMGLESGPGTSGRALSELGSAAAAAMGAIRTCYSDVAERDPTIRGEMRVHLSVGGGRHPATAEIGEGAPADTELTRCVVGALEGADYGELRPGANAYVVLTFTNTAAEGVERTRERRVTEDTVELTHDADGHLSASGGPPDGRLRFTVSALGGESAEAVSAMQRALRATIPTFLDCRRKAGRRGGSPAGQLTADLRVSRRGRGRARVRGNTVQNRYGTAQAGRCFGRGLDRAAFTPAAAGHYRVVLELREQATPGAEDEAEAGETATGEAATGETATGGGRNEGDAEEG